MQMGFRCFVTAAILSICWPTVRAASTVMSDDVAVLLRLSNSEEAILRIAAAKALADTEDARAGERLLAMTQDANDAVKAEAILLMLDSSRRAAEDAYEVSLNERWRELTKTEPSPNRTVKIKAIWKALEHLRFNDYATHVKWLAERAKTLEPGSKLTRIAKVLLMHSSAPFGAVLRTSGGCGVTGVKPYDSTLDVVELYRRTPETFEMAVGSDHNGWGLQLALVLAANQHADAPHMLIGRIDFGSESAKALAMLALVECSADEAEEYALELLRDESSWARAAAAIALLEVDAQTHYPAIYEQVKEDLLLGEKLYDALLFQLPNHARSSFRVFNAPALEKQALIDLALLGFTPVNTIEEFYRFSRAAHLLIDLQGRDALPILKKHLSKVAAELRPIYNEIIKRAEAMDGHSLD